MVQVLFVRTISISYCTHNYMLTRRHPQNHCLCYLMVRAGLIQGASSRILLHTQLINCNLTLTAHHITTSLADS